MNGGRTRALACGLPQLLPLSRRTLSARMHARIRSFVANGPGAAGDHNRFDTSSVKTEWDFQNLGGYFSLSEAKEATRFFFEQGFVVFTDVMSEDENAAAIEKLVADLHEINPSTRAVPVSVSHSNFARTSGHHGSADLGTADDVDACWCVVGHLTSPAQFEEHDLPTSPNHTFRTTCNIAFGRFARVMRGHESIKEAFGMVHMVPPEQLACSWDNPFYTPRANDSCSTQNACTQLHWDMNWWYGGKKAPLADELCVQGVYYATPTSERTPTFVCCPKSQSTFLLFCHSEHNPSKQGAKILNYLPVSDFESSFALKTELPQPVRIHVPARSLLLWDARTCHGNSAPAIPAAVSRQDEQEVGRVAFAICYGPVTQRTAAVHKAGLLMGLAGIRTTHNPAIMLAHDKHGYPPDFVSNDEPNKALTSMQIPLNPALSETDFQQMLAKASDCMTSAERACAMSLTLATVQQAVWNSYWNVSKSMESKAYSAILKLEASDLRRLLHPEASQTQALHPCEMHTASAPALIPWSEEVLQLRQRVMWPDHPIEYSRVDGDEDPHTQHFGIRIWMRGDNANAKIVSVLSVWKSKGQSGILEAQFRKFCTEAAWQGIGLGSRLLQDALAILKEQGVRRVWCNARVEHTNFYGSHGLRVIEGSEFDKGGLGYVMMEATL